MKLIINKDRSVIPVGTWGTKNENNYEILDFEFPEELENYNKRIVYYLDDKRVWDAIVYNKAYITNAITKYEKVNAYVWLTKNETITLKYVCDGTEEGNYYFTYDNANYYFTMPEVEENDELIFDVATSTLKLDNTTIATTSTGAGTELTFETIIDAEEDFRTQLFEMQFYENENADGIVPTQEQVDGFNTMLTAMNNKITEIDTLETAIKGAEADRVLAEQGRVNAENTRVSNENTRQSNEQTRQTQEASREQRTNQAIAQITDMTAAYNQNAQQKTEAFNQNASNKTSNFDSNAESKTNTFNSNTTQKTNAFNSNAESKTNTFNTNATNKTNDFNSNASSKTTAFNNNATNKTTDFNTNAENKTTAFNSNVTDKTTNFDNNASSKTTTFNENATSKTNDFNDNATAKTTAFNDNAQAKTEAFDEHTEEMQQEIDELSANMPWAETEQATEINITDAAKYSKNKLELFGNTEQATNIIEYKCDGTETGDYYFIYDNVNYQFTMPIISANDILVFNTDTLKLYLSDTEITTTTDNTGTLITMQNTPNPDYPQDIRVVSGIPIIRYNNNNLADFLTGSRTWRNTTVTLNKNKLTINKPGNDGLSEDFLGKKIPLIAKTGEKINFVLFYVAGEVGASVNNYNTILRARLYYIDGTNDDISLYINRDNYKTNKRSALKTLTKDLKEIRLRCFVPGESFSTSTRLEYNILISKGNDTDYSDSNTRNVLLELTPNLFDKNTMQVMNGYIDNSNITLRSNYSERTTAIPCKPNTTYIVKKVYVTSRFGVATYNEDNLPVATGTVQSYPVYNPNLSNTSTMLEITTDENSKWLLVYYSQLTDDNTEILRQAAIDTLCIYEKNTGIELVKINSHQDKFEYKNNQIVIPNKIQKIDSYNGESITTDYISTTGGLDNGATVYYVGNEDYVVENEALINSINEFENNFKLDKGVNNITVITENLEPYVTLKYMQDLPSKLDNLDSRLSLLE